LEFQDHLCSPYGIVGALAHNRNEISALQMRCLTFQQQELLFM